jgi:WD40 repeat protein
MMDVPELDPKESSDELGLEEREREEGIEDSEPTTSRTDSGDEGSESVTVASMDPPEPKDEVAGKKSCEDTKRGLYAQLKESYERLHGLRKLDWRERVKHQLQEEEQWLTILQQFPEVGVDRPSAYDGTIPFISPDRAMRQVSEVTAAMTLDKVGEDGQVHRTLSVHDGADFYSLVESRRTKNEVKGVECCGWLEGTLVYVCVHETKQLRVHDLVVGDKLGHHTGFFRPAVSMIIDKSLIWIAGDCRIKSFDVNTLKNIDTLYVSVQSKSPFFVDKGGSMCVWDDFIVLGSQRNLFFWLRNGSDCGKAEIPSEIFGLYEPPGLTVTLVDWKRGRMASERFDLNTVESQCNESISSICSVGSVLAVSFEHCPIIHLYRRVNCKMQMFGSLIGHTMSVSCLRSFKGEKLISTSEDGTVRIWNLESADAEMGLRDQKHRIVSACEGNYGNNNVIFSSDETGAIQIWNLTRKCRDWCFEPPFVSGEAVMSLSFNGQTKILSVMAKKSWNCAITEFYRFAFAESSE